MKNSIAHLVLLLSLTMFGQLGCGKKDADKASGGKPAAATTPPAGDKPAAATTPPAGDKPAASAADLPPECKPFTDAFETLAKCDKLPADGRDSMKAGFQQMLKAMIDLGDKKAMIDGCTQGLESLKQALTTAGC